MELSIIVTSEDRYDITPERISGLIKLSSVYKDDIQIIIVGDDQTSDKDVICVDFVNDGLKLANGDWIYFLLPDDEILNIDCFFNLDKSHYDLLEYFGKKEDKELSVKINKFEDRNILSGKFFKKSIILDNNISFDEPEISFITRYRCFISEGERVYSGKNIVFKKTRLNTLSLSKNQILPRINACIFDTRFDIQQLKEELKNMIIDSAIFVTNLMSCHSSALKTCHCFTHLSVTGEEHVTDAPHL